MPMICINYHNFIEYEFFVKMSTEVFLLAQFLRHVQSFAAIGPEIWRGPLRPPPPVFSKHKIHVAQYS